MRPSHLVRAFTTLSFALLSLSPLVQAAALTEYDAVELVKDFADAFLAPRNAEIARAGNSKLFERDVKGRVDLLGDIDGREQSTEYLFGLFASAAQHADVPSIVGSPVAYNVTQLAVQRHYVSAGIRVDLQYPLIDRTIPVELGAWFAISPNKQIAAYDITFHRWSWAISDLLPALLPRMATWAQVATTNTNTTSAGNVTTPAAPSAELILRTYLGRTICGTALTSCPGSLAPWSSIAECRAYVSSAPLGSFARLDDDSLACRATQAALVSLRPAFYCPAMGEGSSRCRSRDYATTVRQDRYAEGYVAPKIVTPENADEVAGYEVVNGVPITPLLRISLNQDGLKSWDPTLFATATFVYMLFLWVNAKVLYILYDRLSRTFRGLASETLKTNVVMYAMNIFYTFAAVTLQAIAIPAFWRSYALYQVLCVRAAAITICGLYCFELIFRFDMRLPLVAHHFFTIFAICFCVTLFEMTQDMTFLLSGVIWLCQATTEQPTFIGLYMYRMSPPSPFLANLLRFAAAQTLLFKIASAVGVIVIWALHQRSFMGAVDIGWSAMVFTISVGLMATQVWGSWITWKLGDRVMAKYRKGLSRGRSIKAGSSGFPRGEKVKKNFQSSTLATDPFSARSGHAHAHEFSVLMTPPSDVEDPFALSRSVSPVGSDSSKRHLRGEYEHQDPYTAFRPLERSPYGQGQGQGGGALHGRESTASLEPYGHSAGFGERDSVWDLNARPVSIASAADLAAGSAEEERKRGREMMRRDGERLVAEMPHRPRSGSRLRDELREAENGEMGERSGYSSRGDERLAVPARARAGSDVGREQRGMRPEHARALSG